MSPACARSTRMRDYVAVNVSSPNTARLRELQAREGLERILGSLLEERADTAAALTARRVPLLVKVAPDLDPEQISALAAEAALAAASTASSPPTPPPI